MHGPNEGHIVRYWDTELQLRKYVVHLYNEILKMIITDIWRKCNAIDNRKILKTDGINTIFPKRINKYRLCGKKINKEYIHNLAKHYERLNLIYDLIFKKRKNPCANRQNDPLPNNNNEIKYCKHISSTYHWQSHRFFLDNIVLKSWFKSVTW